MEEMKLRLHPGLEDCSAGPSMALSCRSWCVRQHLSNQYAQAVPLISAQACVRVCEPFSP